MSNTLVLSVNSAWNIINFRSELVLALREAGYKVVVAAPNDEYVPRLKFLGCQYVSIRVDNGRANPIRDLALMRQYYKLLKELKPFCYLGFTPKPNIYGSLAARILSIPCINNVGGLGAVFIRRTSVTHITKMLYKCAFARSYRVFFQNSDDQDYFISAALIDRRKAFRIPGSGIDTAKFCKQKAPQSRAGFRFLLVGRLLWDKGVGEYVEAARLIKARYEDVEFGLLGFVGVANPSAVPRTQIDDWVREGLISYLGHAADVVPHLEAADCVVLPSYREGVPRSLLEAASIGKPIITTDAIGCREVVDPGVNGYLSRVGDSRDLAEKMELMLQLSVERRRDMGEKGREKMVSQFDIHIVISAYLRALDELRRS